MTPEPSLFADHFALGKLFPAFTGQVISFSLLHYCHVIDNVNDEKLENEWISGPEKNINLHTMIVDFPRHLKLHLDEINNLIETTKLTK